MKEYNSFDLVEVQRHMIFYQHYFQETADKMEAPSVLKPRNLIYNSDISIEYDSEHKNNLDDKLVNDDDNNYDCNDIDPEDNEVCEDMAEDNEDLSFPSQ